VRLPEAGFSKAKTFDGREVGLAFYCPTCRVLFVAEAPSEVKHCGGRIDKADEGFFSLLPTYTLENFGYSKSLVQRVGDTLIIPTEALEK
jgi:hypothetical protein